MARYRMRIRTDWSQEDAFAYLSDLSNFDDWDPGTKRAVQVKGDGPGPGAEYDLDAPTTLRYVVQAYDPPARVQARARNRFVTSVDTITVTPDDGGGSTITYEADLTGNGPLRVADPLLKLMFDRLGGRAADGLVAKTGGTRLS